jgi:ribonuclease P protein component
VNKIYIIRGRRLFKEIFKRGKKFKGAGIRVTILKSSEDSELFINKNQKKCNSYSKIGIGIIISRKYGKAVERNRAKRRIREICRELLSEMKTERGNLVIINPQIEFKDQEYQISKTILRLLFEKAGLMKK